MRAAGLAIEGSAFRDSRGRQILLRGVNLGGDVKVPFVPDGRTHIPTDFADHRSVSFVGRPAPLDELDRHLRRLRHWGFNCLRLLTTWEAIEHAGPGQHDQAYLDYIAEVCRRAGDLDLWVFIDFHQDAWSRMSGGDGAPGWTFDVAGLDFRRFGSAGAALVMQHAYDPSVGGIQSSYPRMSWPSNYARPANGIMWTLFFAGTDFAPDATFDGAHVQTILQDAYFGSMGALAERVASCANVIGFDTLNEPGTGYIGKALSDPLCAVDGVQCTALDGLALASGIPCETHLLRAGRPIDVVMLNADRETIWLPGRTDPFRAAGVWDTDRAGRAVALRPDHFRLRGDHAVDHGHDYMVPFFDRVATTIRSVRDDWLVFAEVDPFAAEHRQGFPMPMPERTVNATHWYDMVALYTKSFSSRQMSDPRTGITRTGPDEIQEAYLAELSAMKDFGLALNGGAPTLIGEFGIQFDMNDRASYDLWDQGERGDDIWEDQTEALTLTYNVFDQLLLNSTQWNYTASNSNDQAIGDGWNQEDLSIYSPDQAASPDDLDEGGRAIRGFCRPYVRASQGDLLEQAFDRETGRFHASIQADPSVGAPTEIYIPAIHYPDGFAIEADGAPFEVKGQALFVTASSRRLLTVRITRT